MGTAILQLTNGNPANGFEAIKNTVVVSPDLGNAKEASHFARSLDLPMAAGSKKRLSDDRVVIDTLVGNVDGKNVIVLDDEIANGGTILEVLKKLRELRVKEVAVACRTVSSLALRTVPIDWRFCSFDAWGTEFGLRRVPFFSRIAAG